MNLNKNIKTFGDKQLKHIIKLDCIKPLSESAQGRKVIVEVLKYGQTKCLLSHSINKNGVYFSKKLHISFI